MGFKIGLNGKVYRLTTGTRASWGTVDGNGIYGVAAASVIGATLDEVVQVTGEVTINLEKSEADVSIRGGGGWGADAGTLKDASVEITLIYDPADADYLAIMKAKLAKTSIALAILDGTKNVAGTQGLWADFVVSNVSKGEPIEGPQTVAFTFKPTLNANLVAPQWVKVTA